MTEPPQPPVPGETIQAVRRFNRFYTLRLGTLYKDLLAASYSPTESRLLWELAHREQPTASELAQALALDSGYLSRLLGGLKARGLVASAPSQRDARQHHLRLTAHGRRAFALLDARTQAAVQAELTRLTTAQQQQLTASMAGIEQLLGEPNAPAAPWLLRPHRPGDMGWVVSRHGALYAAEHGFDLSFEALVARLVATFLERYEPAREACWIVEREGVNLASVFLVQARDPASHAPRAGVAQLRMLLVEPEARGLGLGVRLVQECERYARQAGYRKIVLATHSLLADARRLYQRAGYALVHQSAHHSFGQDLVAETWELAW